MTERKRREGFIPIKPVQPRIDTDGHGYRAVAPTGVQQVGECDKYFSIHYEDSRISDKNLTKQFFFLSPRRRSGERTEERGKPKRASSPRLSPPSDGGEGVAAASPRWVYQYASVVPDLVA